MAPTSKAKESKPKAPRKPYARRAPPAIREKKKFEFLALPRELRDEIYEQYAGTLRSRVAMGEMEKARKPFVGTRFSVPCALEKRRAHVFLYLSRQTREEYLQTIPKRVELYLYVNSQNKGHFKIAAPLLQNVRTVDIWFNIQSAFVDFLKTSSSNVPEEMIAHLDRLVMSLAKVETLQFRFCGKKHVLRVSKCLASHIELLGRAAQRRQQSITTLQVTDSVQGCEQTYTKVDAETVRCRSTLWPTTQILKEEYDTK